MAAHFLRLLRLIAADPFTAAAKRRESPDGRHSLLEIYAEAVWARFVEHLAFRPIALD
jgi:hypothetical protein